MLHPETSKELVAALATKERRKTWVTPQLRSIEAGSAENGFTQNTKDGQFTRS